MITDDGEVALPALVLHLVDRDGDQPIEQILGRERFFGQPDAGVVDRPPRQPVPVGGCLLVGHHRVMDHHILQRRGEARVMPGEGQGHHGRAMLGTVHPGRDCDELAGRIADVDVAPATLPVALVKPRAARAAAPAPVSSARAQTDSDLERGAGGGVVDLGQLPPNDHDSFAQTEHVLEYLVDAHAVVLLVSSRCTAGNVGRRRRALTFV